MAFKIKDSLRIGTVDVFDSSGNLLVVPGKATNLAGGAASQIPYQSSANTTAFIANGTSGQFLKSNGASAPSWADVPTGVTVTSDNTATTFYPLFTTSTSGALADVRVDNVTTPLSYVPSTGTLSAAVFSGSGASLTSIPNSALTNSSITINGSAISLGGSVSNLALTTGNLSQFAATTSAQLAGVISDETGSGALVFGTSPTITTSIVAGSATLAVFNTVATTVNAFGAATALSLGAATGTTTIANNLAVTGNLTINGTTTTVNSTTVTIDDPIFTLGGDTAPAADDNKDRGIEFRWHNGTAAKVGFFGFDDSTGKLTFIPDATNTSEVFSGSIGEIDATIAWSNVTGDTTVGSNLVTLANPSAITFLRINADNTVSALDAASFRTAIGAGTSSTTGTVTSVGMTVPTGLSISGSPITSSGTLALTLTAGYVIPTTTSASNWDTAYTDRNKWDGGSTGLVAATGRTSLGATTVGSNLFTLTNPSAITFLRVNADNTVSALDAATFRTAIGAQASGSYLTAEADTLATVTGRGATTGVALTFTNATDSTSSTTGALIIDGGVAIKKNLTVVGNLAETTSAGTKIADSNTIQATVATTSATAVDTWAVATYRSCKYVVQITQGTNYQVSEILVIHNGTTTTMTEFAVLETNGALATFTSDVNTGNARLLVTMGSATSATINVTKTMMVI